MSFITKQNKTHKQERVGLDTFSNIKAIILKLAEKRTQLKQLQLYIKKKEEENKKNKEEQQKQDNKKITM